MFNFDRLYNKLRRRTTTTSFIPQIDGLRFLAIILVLFEHLNGFIITKVPFSFDKRPIDYWVVYEFFDKNGRKGVLLFFAISGFILALPFAKAYWQQAKKVDLKGYFLRRLTRLEPPYIITMVVCYLAIRFYGGHGFTQMFAGTDLLKNLGASLIYMHNIIYPNTFSVNPVAWSLEIEVQFYLLVPLLVLMLKLPKLYRRSLVGFLALFFVFLQNTFPSHILTIYSFIQYFLLGFLLVDVYLSGFELKMHPVLSFITGSGLFISMVYLDIYRNNWYEYIFVVMLFCFGVMALTNRVWKKILSIRILTSIGGMCYSIYLWHNLVVSGVGNQTIRFNISHSYFPDLLWHYAILFPVVLLFSGSFYLLIERPCMDKDWPKKLWHRLMNKKLVSQQKDV